MSSLVTEAAAGPSGSLGALLGLRMRPRRPVLNPHSARTQWSEPGTHHPPYFLASGLRRKASGKSRQLAVTSTSARSNDPLWLWPSRLLRCAEGQGRWIRGRAELLRLRKASHHSQLGREGRHHHSLCHPQPWTAEKRKAEPEHIRGQGAGPRPFWGRDAAALSSPQAFDREAEQQGQGHGLGRA